MADEKTTPFISALQSGDIQQLSSLLGPHIKADIGGLRVERTVGEGFTGGRSTPVWRLYFTASRGSKSRETQLVVKWVRFPVPHDDKADFRSRTYANERQFYLNAAGVVRKACHMPHMLLDECVPSDVCFVFNDLTVDYPLHPDCLSIPQAQGALSWLARFHAHFWEADAAGSSFPAGMCDSGDYWGLAKKDNAAALASIGQSLTASSKVLKAQGAWDLVKTLGQRLVAAAHALDSHLRRSKGFVRHRTLIHGDFKTANFFLREASSGSFEAAVLDFEMAGPGLAAVDLAYFLFPDLRMNLLEEETELLRFYHAMLTQQLDALGSGADYPLELLTAHYAAARCDHFRYMLGRGWTAVSSGDVALVVRVHQDMARYDGGQILEPERYDLALAESFSGKG
mmetsp:Transcript_54961/g.177933  ORF Transcript_54961/g.177933 Transcript_54961/m.177933 type:complete len:398 (-) Transcript_54961:6-1199(-)